MGVGPEAVCGCVQGFPTNHTAVPVSGSSMGSGLPPTHIEVVGWNNPHALDRRMWNQGQNSFLIGLAAGNGFQPGSVGKSHWSAMEIF